jgi:O-methyltransferase
MTERIAVPCQTLSLIERYLSLLKKSLLDELYLENEARIAYLINHAINNNFPPLAIVVRDYLNIRHHPLFSHLQESRKQGEWLMMRSKIDQTGRRSEIGEARNFAFNSHSMIGRARMDNLHTCLDTIIADGIAGDLIETGVWKGGATIFMRGYLAAHDIHDRLVWVADSFEGLPPPNHEMDKGFDMSRTVFPYLSVSIEEVCDLFQRYDLLDDQVRFLKGWFRDTLPSAPIHSLALLRLDGDLYESTMDALNNLYHRLSPGGFAIVDDYNALPQCKQAVQDFRDSHGITEEIVPIDRWAAYWRRSR